MPQMKRYKVRAIVTAHHLIAVQAVDEKAAKAAAIEKHTTGRLGQVVGHMKVMSCEEWPKSQQEQEDELLPPTGDPSPFMFDGD